MIKVPASLPRYVINIRRFVYLMLVTITTFTALAMITSAFQQNGMTPQELVLLIMYGLLILWISTSFWTAVIGFFLLIFSGDKWSLPRIAGIRNPEGRKGKVALVMPIYNEDPNRVFSGLSAIWQSLQETGKGERFELFILSDTREPDKWMQEERKWYELCSEFHAHGRIFYRNREKNIARKSGNLEDFCRRWGGRYEYMVVLDADSLMEGETLVKMMELMDMHPRVALIQSPPLPANHRSLFARILQFASNLYSDIFIAGTNFWQLSESNYWGHNAIIRMKPFTELCGLPKLPGKEPFGGEILSHDFVEAALLREAGWEVWLVPELKGSYEELPPTLIDYAKRDRRWCQGNLQHLRMVFAKNISGLSRLYFLMGIMSYLSSPLWLMFLILTGFEAYIKSQTMPVYFFGDNLFPVWPESYAVEMTTVLLVTLAMLFMPKILSLVLLIIQRKRLKEYGGFIKALFSVLFETIFSVLTAPILMLYQTKFVFSILLRKSVGWPSQNRDDHRLGFLEAVQAHGGHTLIGFLAGYISYEYVPDFFLWLIPVLAGLVLSIPVSMISSSAAIGMAARKMGIFITPEEFKEPRIITLLKYRMDQNELREQQRMEMLGLQSAHNLELTDPATFSLHSALLPNRIHNKRVYHELRALIYKLIEDGPEKLSFADKRNLISDRDTLAKLHYLAWSQRKPFKQ